MRRVPEGLQGSDAAGPERGQLPVEDGGRDRELRGTAPACRVGEPRAAGPFRHLPSERHQRRSHRNDGRVRQYLQAHPSSRAVRQFPDAGEDAPEI